jgi:hypothetical protein
MNQGTQGYHLKKKTRVKNLVRLLLEIWVSFFGLFIGKTFEFENVQRMKNKHEPVLLQTA